MSQRSRVVDADLRKAGFSNETLSGGCDSSI